MDLNRFLYLVFIGVFFSLFLVSCYPYFKFTKDYMETAYPILYTFELIVGDTDLMLNDSISIGECQRILYIPKFYEVKFARGEIQSEDDYWRTVSLGEERSIDTIDWDKIVYFNQVNKNNLWVTKNANLEKWAVHSEFPIELDNKLFYCLRLIDEEELGIVPFVIFVYSYEKNRFIKDYKSVKRIKFYSDNQ